MNTENFKITIPEISDNTVKVYVNDEYIGNADADQVDKIRVDVADYIQRTNDESILNTFYFIGHADTNNGIMGNEIKFTMTDRYGNLSDFPWELTYTRRALFHLMNIRKERMNTIKK